MLVSGGDSGMGIDFWLILLYLPSGFLALTVLMNRGSLKGPQLSHSKTDPYLLYNLPLTHYTVSTERLLMCAASKAPWSTLSLTLNWNLAQAAWSPDKVLLPDLTPSHLQPLSACFPTLPTYSSSLLGGSLCFWGDSWCVTPGSQPLHGPWFPTALGPAEERERVVREQEPTVCLGEI